MGEPNWANRTIWTGDNIDIMRGMNSESVDLIYLDPPFNSNADHAAPAGSRAAGAAFKDTWTLADVDVEWIDLIENGHPKLHRVLLAAMAIDDRAYLAYMAARLLEMRRILKRTGTICLHCDPTMGHYLKLLMDAVFDRGNFLNEVVWHYQTGGAGRRWFSRKHDTILIYGKTSEHVFNVVDVPRSEKSIARARNPKGARIARDDTTKMAMDVWVDIPALNPQAKERLGYPTQKPLALLDRIVRALSDEGGMVLDPFCGCATACMAAERRRRRWVGIDISPKAAALARARMRDAAGPSFRETHRNDIPRRTDLGNLPPCRTRKPALHERQGGNCNGCGAHFQPRHLAVDHIVSREKGGTDHMENLQLLCGSCKAGKRDRGLAYLRAKLQV